MSQPENKAQAPSLAGWSMSFPALLFLSALLLIGLIATYVTVVFATHLGFYMHPSLLYPAIAIILLVFILGGKRLYSVQTMLASNLKRDRLNGLSLVIVISLIVRLIFITNASVLPDEYSVFRILEARPLSNLPLFLRNYEDFAGGLVSHPPLSFILMSFGYTLLPSPLGARAVSVVFSLMTIVVVYLIMVELGKREYATLTAAIYGLIPLTVLYLSMALTDVYMNFFGLVAILMYLKALNKPSVMNAALSGVALGLSFWSKQGLGIFWAIAMVMLTFVLHTPRLRGGMAKLGLALLVAGAIYFAWWLVNPVAFEIGFIPLVNYLLTVVLSPENYRLISTNIPNVPSTTSTTTITATTLGTIVTTVVTPTNVNPFFSSLESIFPPLTESRGSSISYAELIVQLPIWLTPLVLLLSMVGISRLLIRRDRRDFLLLLWAIVPLIAMIPGIRDIRYILLFSVPVAYFGGLGSKVRNVNLSRYLKSAMFAFMVVFLVITLLVAQQQYSGIAEASHDLQTLNLGSESILSNAPQIQYYLPDAKLYYLPPDYNSSTVIRIIAQKSIAAVVIVHNARAAWLLVGSGVIDILRLQFRHCLTGGLSTFSWYEIYY
jgi:hypothetical protein